MQLSAAAAVHGSRKQVCLLKHWAWMALYTEGIGNLVYGTPSALGYQTSRSRASKGADIATRQA
jgi:hypothetical protein